MEGSGKWPANEEAASKLKAALACQLAAELESQFGMISRASEHFVDVHHEGFALRLLLWSDQDVALASRAAKVCTWGFGDS
jgi:uncharacterized protein YgfB (UPF0149 family)